MFVLFVPLSVQALHTFFCHDHGEVHTSISLVNYYQEIGSDCCDVFHFLDKTTYFSFLPENIQNQEIFRIQKFLEYSEKLVYSPSQKKSSRAPPVS